MSQLVLEGSGIFGFRAAGTGSVEATGQAIWRHQQQLQLGYPERERLAQELSDFIDPQAVALWLGIGARAANPEAIRSGLRFLALLSPAYLAGMEVSPDGDGSISFDWYIGAERQLTINLGEQGELHYAAVIGTVERASGRLLFDDSIPDEIARLIGRITQP
jgi:hypothetical protein